MEIHGSLDIKQKHHVVAQLFADPNHLGEYQEGFVRKENVSGDPGQDGAVAKMYYKTGSREMELVETVTANRLPDSFEASYHHKHMDNTMKCQFTTITENLTKFEYHINYTAFRGLVPKLMALLFPGVFKKQVDRWMTNFKGFVENQDIINS